MLVLALAACVPGGRTPAPVPQELAWLLEQDAPTDVTPVLEPDRTTSAVLGAAGGVLEATAADGTTYTLTIPADALRGDTEVTLTPVTSMTGSPFEETASYGVEIGPDGTQLDAWATVEIVPSSPVAADSAILYQYGGEGHDVRFALPTPGSTGFSISTDHFSGYGTAATAPNKAQEAFRLGGDAEAAIRSELGRRVQIQAKVRSDSADEAGPFLDLYRDYVLEPRIAHATDSCAAGLVAATTYATFDRMRVLLGLAPQADGRMSEIVAATASTCMDQEYTYCTQEHLVHRILPLYVAMLRMIAIQGIGDDALVQQLRSKVEGCLAFRLDFESDAVLEGDSGWESTVESTIDLTVDLDATDDRGVWTPGIAPASGPLINTSVTAEQAGWTGCSAVATPTDGELQVRSLRLLADGFDAVAVESGQQRVGALQDVQILFQPTVAGGELQITCPSSTFQVPKVPGMWFSPFLAAHKDELDETPQAGGVRFTGWSIGDAGGAVVAAYTWTATGDRVHESGTFTLTHVPR